MRIEGNYIFNAAPELIWSLLHDPVIIQQTLPGCDEFDQTATTDYVAALNIQHGPFKGRYLGQIQLVDNSFRESFTINLEGEGPEGTISGNGTIFLDEQEDSTIVRYAGNVDFAGATAAESPRLLQTITNALIRQFFESFDVHVRVQTGIHTTQLPDENLRSRRRAVVDVDDVIAEIEQDRQTFWVVIALIAVTVFSLAGVGMVLLLLVRWGKRIFDRQVNSAVQKQLEDNRLP